MYTPKYIPHKLVLNSLNVNSFQQSNNIIVKKNIERNARNEYAYKKLPKATTFFLFWFWKMNWIRAFYSYLVILALIPVLFVWPFLSSSSARCYCALHANELGVDYIILYWQLIKMVMKFLRCYICACPCCLGEVEPNKYNLNNGYSKEVLLIKT